MNKKLALATLLVAAIIAGFLAWRGTPKREDVALEPSARPVSTTRDREPVAPPDAAQREPAAVVSPPAPPPQPAQQAAKPTAPPMPEAVPTRMFVRIVDGANGLAIVGARIERAREEQPDLESDARGLCSFVFTRPTSFSLSTNHDGPLPRGFCRVYAAGFGPTEFHETEGHETEERALVIRSSQAAALVVTLLRRPDMTAGAYTVRAAIPASSLMQNDIGTSLDFDFGSLRIDAACDAWGNARLEGLPANIDFPLSVLRRGSSSWTKPEPLRLKPGEERAVEIDLGGGCRVQAHVVDADEERVPNFEVWLARRGEYPRQQFADYDKKDLAGSGRTDDKGQIDFGEIPAGRYMLGPSPKPVQRYKPAPDQAPPRELTGINLEVEILESERTRDLELRVLDGLFIEGTVYAPDGSVYDKRGVQIFCGAKNGHHVMGFTKQGGSFRCGPLMSERYTLQTGGAQGLIDSLPVEADPGRTDVALVLRTGSRLVVRIAEFSGGPGVSAGLTLAYHDSSHAMTVGGSTPGYYDMGSLAPGAISLAAATQDCRCGVLPSVELLPGARQEVEVLLAPGAKLRIRSSDGAKLGMIKVTQDGATVAVPSRGYESGQIETCVPPGELVVTRGKTSQQTVTVAVGEEREIVFEP